LIESGQVEDFHHWPSLSYRSKQFYSKDNWYIVGDSAFFPDPLYGPGITMISYGVESITDLICSHLDGHPDTELKRTSFNKIQLNLQGTFTSVFEHTAPFLGHPTAFMNKVMADWIFWFNILLPFYLSKWFLEPRWGVVITRVSQMWTPFRIKYHKFLSKIPADRNVSWTDVNSTVSLCGNFVFIAKDDEADGYFREQKMSPFRLNIFRHISRAYRQALLWWIQLTYSAYGFFSLFSPLSIWIISFCIVVSFVTFLVGCGRAVQTWRVPCNDQHKRDKDELLACAKYEKALVPWKESD